MENSMRVDDVSTHSDIHENIDIDEIDVGIQIPENVSDIESNITSPKDDEDSKHKVFQKCFLYIEDADTQINGFLSMLEPAKGKLFTFERKKEAQVIINLLTKKGLKTVLLSKSIRYPSKKK